MNAYLIDSAKALSEADAGGHGGRWGVIGDPAALFKRWLNPMVQEAEYADLGLKVPLEEVVEGSPVGLGLMHADDKSLIGRAGAMSVVEKIEPTATEEGQLQFTSTVPFFAEGVEIESEVGEIAMHPNRLEARLSLDTPEGALIEPYDTLFWKHGPHYREGELYRFRVSGLAYNIRQGHKSEVVINDPERIRACRAREAWSKKYGSWERERDEAVALAAWQSPSEEDLKPIRMDLSRMYYMMPASSGPADDHSYRGEVKSVTPRIFTLYGMPFWRVKVTLLRRDSDFVLPLFVAEGLFESDWRPAVGEFIEGSLWLQAYALSKV